MDVVEAFLRAHSYICESKPTNASLYNLLNVIIVIIIIYYAIEGYSLSFILAFLIF
jgi:hypothetical protein